MALYSRDAVLSFISAYRSLPELWDQDHVNYNKRRKRKAAYDILLKIMKESVPDATRANVNHKIRCLRNSFRREWNKVVESKKSGEVEYDPRLWYYDKLLFLVDSEKRAELMEESAKSIEIHDADNDPLGNLECEDVHELLQEFEIPYQKTKGVSANIKVSDRPTPAKVFKLNPTSAQEQFMSVAEKLMTSEVKMDNWEAFGLSIAGDLRSLKDYEQQTIAQKLVSDVIYLAKMGMLSADTKIIVNKT